MFLKHAYLAQLCMLVRHGQLKRLIRIKCWPLKCTAIEDCGSCDLNWTMKVTNKEVWKKLHIKTDLMQTIMKRKLGLFGYICRMENSRKIKSVMLGIMDGEGRRGRPNMEWIDNIKEWCNKDLHSLTISALDRKFWKQTIKFVLDTYGLSAHGS